MIAILYKFASQLVKNNEIGRFPMVYPFMFTGLLRKTLLILMYFSIQDYKLVRYIV